METVQEWSPARRGAAAGGVAALGASLYYTAGEPVRIPHPAIPTQVDQLVPFIPESVWLYEPPYLLGFVLTAWAIRERKAYLASLASVTLVVSVATIFFLLFPFAGPRPDLATSAAFASADGWTAAFIQWVYAHDPNYNTFPSLHVTLSTLNAAMVSRYRKRLGRAMAAAAAIICVTVLTTKQHWAVDVAGGLALAGFGFAVWNALLRSPALVAWPARKRAR